MTIEGMVNHVVISQFERVGGFHINWVRVGVYLEYGISLSYKQARNALYRLRSFGGILHYGCGVYGFVFPYFRDTAIRRWNLFVAISGGIYYRRLAKGLSPELGCPECMK